METLDKYKIDLKGMQSDACTYGFLLDDQFFTLIDAPEIQKGRVYVSLNVKRLSQAFELNFQTEGTVTVLCDRCLDEMQQPIHSLDNLIVKFGDGYAEEDDNLIIVPESVGIINVAWYMYEFIALAIPIKHVHAEGECNADMRMKLDELSCASVDETDNSVESECGKQGGDGNMPIDPRWNELKKLLDNN